MNFKLSLTTGETFNIVEDQNKTLIYIIKNYILNKIPNLLIEAAVVDGKKLDINKTLFENKVKQNFNIVIYVAILPRSKINKLNISRIYFVSTHINQILQFRKCLKFIVDGCKVPLEMLDLESKYFENWRISSKSGPPGYLKTFFPPVGWIDIGVKAWNEGTWKIKAPYIAKIKAAIDAEIKTQGLQGRISFEWVKGHQNRSVLDPDAVWNNKVDLLAKGESYE